MPQEIELKVNGSKYQVSVEPDTPLAYVLRNDLGFKGVKYGCGAEQCGACNVLIDGVSTPSCHLAVSAVQGSDIVTIEGLGAPDDLHPLQEAFIEEQATQCGYCTPGMVIAAQGLLNQQRYPTEAHINQALDGHLCRCGTHERVRRAIKLRIARPDSHPLYETRELAPIPESQELPQILTRFPNLDDWIRVDQAGTFTVFSGKVEYGQGLKTALAQIAAEELDLSLERIRMVMGDTDQTPDEGMTLGSMSLQTSGVAIRQVAAEARHFLVQLAIEELEALPGDLSVLDGTITDRVSGKSTSYWELLGGKPFGIRVSGLIPVKPAESYGIVGESEKRLDLPGKVTGTHPYVQDLVLEGMVHARVVRPPTYRARLVDLDSVAVEAMPGVLKIVRDGSFVGVIAEREEQAVRAMEVLSQEAVWEIEPIESQLEDLYAEIQSGIDESYLVLDGTVSFDPIPAIMPPEDAALTLGATYTKPYHMHATIGPSSALAWLQEGALTIWAHSQGAFPPRENIAHVLQMPVEAIHFIHVEGSGTYGHNGADDAALDAALLAVNFPGVPVLLKWTRENENQWEPYQPPAVIQMSASLDDTGMVIAWNHDVYSPPHIGRSRVGEGASGMLASWYLEKPMGKPPYMAGMWNNGGSHRNADPLYAFAHKRIAKHVQLKPALRISSFRGLGAFANIFAIESFMDELAYGVGADPLEFRLRNLRDGRAIAVLEAVAEKSNWGAPLPENHGRGVAFARYKNSAAYCAIVVQACADPDLGDIHLERATIVGESGQVVNPDGLSNQLEGGFIQAASMALVEKVRYDFTGVLSVDWETYPIAAFSDIPLIETLILNRPGTPFLGSGEASIGPTPAAIANAVFAACGVRLRDIPFREHWLNSIQVKNRSRIQVSG